MNRINKLFQEKKQNIFSLYFCAGHPQLDSTTEIIRTLENKGVDLIEIGIPFSDPLADGPSPCDCGGCRSRRTFCGPASDRVGLLPNRGGAWKECA